MKYPYKCSRCGFCCVMENCEIAIEMYGIPKFGVKCPALRFDENMISRCAIAQNTFHKAVLGIGVGCCIKARVYQKGEQIDFASCSNVLKTEAVKQALLQKGYL